MTEQRAVTIGPAWPSPDEVADVVAGAASAAGHEPADVAADVAAGEWGGNAYACTLRTADGPWSRPLIARAARLGDALHNAAAGGEAAWHAHLAAHGIGVPPILAAGVTGAGGDGLVATVMARTHEHSLIELISAEPMGAADLLARAGQLHVAVHEAPVADAPPALGPIDVVDASADAAARHDLAAEHAWLAEHRPGPAETPVICHGALSPSQIRMDPADPDAVVVTTWTSVTIDAHERDVAQTALTLWSIPHVAQRRAERMMLKMFRDTLVANYRDGYTAAAGVDLDPALLAWWGAAHTLEWSIRVARSQAEAERDPWDPAHLVVKADAFRKDLRAHFWDHTKEVER